MGYGIWLVGCEFFWINLEILFFKGASCFAGVHLSKTGLTVHYGRWPQQILGAGICITLGCFIICEWIVHKKRFLSIDPDRVEHLYNIEIKSTDEEIETEEVCFLE